MKRHNGSETNESDDAIDKKIKLESDSESIDNNLVDSKTTSTNNKTSGNLKFHIEPTTEQQQILDHAKDIPKGKLTRVIAGAGTGKTTTLVMLAKTLTQDHHNVLYLVYNKAAQEEAEARFAGMENITCLTMHSAAFRYSSIPSTLKIVDDEHELSKAILKHYHRAIRDWLARHNALEIGRSAEKRNETKIELVSFWIFKTLLNFFRTTATVKNLTYNDYHTYYPAKLNHMSKFNFAHGKFYVCCAREVWEMIWSGTMPMIHDAYLKFAQLGHFTARKYTCILLDESQDTNACQLDLFVRQQRESKAIILVGDAVQTIYSFRGSKSKLIMDLDNVIDFSLTTCFRFGPEIAKIANMILAMKENSPQGDSFIPYRLTGASSVPGEIVRHDLPFPFTSIARSNEQLLIRGVELIMGNDQLKIAINGGKSKFTGTCNDIRDILRFSLGEPPQKAFLKKHDTYHDFKTYVEEQEISKYYLCIALIEKNSPELLLEKIQKFEDMILNKSYTLEEADVILTTTHGAKGLEYDHVEVCDDFYELDVKEKSTQKIDFTLASLLEKKVFTPMEFDFLSYGDDVNLWYVAVTRAKKILKLPRIWWLFIEEMQTVLQDENKDDCPIIKGKQMLYQLLQ